MPLQTWTDEQLRMAIETADSYADALRKLNLVAAGGNFRTFKRHVARLQLDTAHFQRKAQLNALRRTPLPAEIILCEHSHVVSAKVSVFVRRHNLLPYVCAACGNTGVHQGKPLTLQLDHRSGVGNDNRLENLRFLCPNCHSQTETYAGRGRKGKRGAEHKKPHKGRHMTPQKVPYTVLAERYTVLRNYSAVAREHGVTGTTVRKAVLREAKHTL